ncbi:MAG TPA: PfkB family carbohydrate kinase [Xanthobacteraceae bacterium]|nr:PfkB family carbohydrate kinase [Xanthobacteraceae bacterium]
MSWSEMPRPAKSLGGAPSAPTPGASAPRILCAGIIVLDEVFRVETVPQPDGKVEAKDFFVVSGGCAANAAITIARLGGRAALAGPLGGPAGTDGNGDFVLTALAREQIDCSAVQRIDGLATGLSAIFIDARGERTIVTYRDQRIATAMPADPEGVTAAADLVLADNRYPQFVRPICEAAQRRRLRIVLDADKATVADDPLFRIASHVVFSAECLRASSGRSDLAEGLWQIARHTEAFLAVSNGPDDILLLDGGVLRRLPVFAIRAVDTLAAGDTLHGGFALALAEGQNEAEALRFGAAVAGIKCTRIGGSAGAPKRAEVEAFLAERRVSLS